MSVPSPEYPTDGDYKWWDKAIEMEWRTYKLPERNFLLE
jgi:hypothetical protein